jgi:hypothetical protein
MPKTAAHLVATQFKPGQPSANPLGRPKGARSRLSEATLAALADDFELHGKETIERVRQRRPETYLACCVSLLPRRTEKLESPLIDLTDKELEMCEQLLASMRAKTVKELEPHTPKSNNGKTRTVVINQSPEPDTEPQS